MKTTDEGRGIVPLLMFLARRYPGRAMRVVILVALSGLAEGIGIITVLPLLQIAEKSGSVSGGPTRLVFELLRDAGITPAVGPILALIVLGLLLKGGLFLLAIRQAGYIGADVSTDLRLDLIRALAEARWGYFTRQPSGRLTNSITTEAIRTSNVTTEACYMLAAIIQATIYLALALLVSWVFTVASLAFGALLFLSLFRVIRAARRAGSRETELLQSLSSRLADGLHAIKPLKAMAREDTLTPILEGESRELNAVQRRQALSRAILPAVQEPMIAIVLAIGLYLALRSSVILFDELLFLALVFYRIATRMGNVQVFYQSVMTLEQSFWSLQDSIRAAQDAKEEHSGASPPRLEDAIELRQVSFGYGEKLVLDRVDLRISQGKITTIFGSSGAGKTTVADLVVGLLRPTHGEVFVDGIPLAQLDLRAWRSKVGYVPQDLALVNDSVMLNVSMGQPEVSREQVELALRAADAWSFVSSLPEGLDTFVGEKGLQLSGGQRQRISIARALISDPRLVILDEPTTALDPLTEQAICRTLDKLRGRVTMLVISHQTPLAEIADQVVRLEPVHTAVGPEGAQ